MERLGSTDAMEQAKQLASLLLSLTRQILAQNDPIEQLPLAQLRVCGVLYGGRRSMSALSRELGVSLSAITQIADRLERAGWVQRVADSSDRRVRSLQLTPRGEKLLRRREEVRVRRIEEVLDHLSPEARAQVVEAFEVLNRACAAADRRDAEPAPLRSAGADEAVSKRS